MITHDMVTKGLINEFEPHVFVTDASDLQLKGWPEMLDTNLGNGLAFIRGHVEKDAEGDIVKVTYRQANGCVELRVYND